MAQPHKVNSGVQPFKSFADTVCGHEVQVRGRNQSGKQNPVSKQKMLSEAPMSLPGPTTLEGRVVGSRRNAEEFYVGKTNSVGYNRIPSLYFKSNRLEHGFGNKRELGSSDWARNSLTIEVNREGKKRVAWNKGGLRSSLWVSRDQREHVPSGSRVLKYPMVGSGTQVGLVIFGPEPTGPMRLEVGESPTMGDLILLRLEAHAPVMSKAPREASEAQDIVSAIVNPVIESPVPPVKASIARYLGDPNRDGSAFGEGTGDGRWSFF